MKLIDADVLREHVFALTEHVGDERLHIDAVVHLIDDALTVDAVPIKWLENLAAQHDGADSVTCHVIAYLIRLILKKWKDGDGNG